MRVVIADDSYLIREGTRRLLEDSGQVEVVSSVGSGPELVDAVHRLGPEAVLTDIRMPPAGSVGQTGAPERPSMEGIAAAHAIKSAHPSIGVVVLSQYLDASYAFELLRNGANGMAYLLKDRIGDLDRLLYALRGRHRGLGHRPARRRRPGGPAHARGQLTSGHAQSPRARRAA